ncbi:MAG: hypothetical protein L6R37_000519 [Teloschistes peruensis]|nr:MAG: hypothetical protein L6R37_000519 [Teloschistes peruensis]
MLLQSLTLLAFVSAALAVVTSTTTLSSSTSSTLKCTTALVKKSPKGAVPTSTSTKILAADIILILGVSTPRVTQTAPPSTTTSTSTSTTTVTTTNAAVTGTFSTTSTIEEVLTSTSTTTALVTSVVSSTTSSTSTLVIPTTAGFIDASSSSGRQNAALQGRDMQAAQPVEKREVMVHHLSKRAPPPRNDPQADLYPASVQCVKSVQVHIWVKLILVKPAITTTISGPVLTATATTISTTTSTKVPPGVSITSTFFATTTSTNTLTQTVSSTTTSTEIVTEVSTTTSYAACATPNVLGPALSNGNFLFNVIRSADAGGGDLTNPDAASALECCIACQTSATCQFSFYSLGSRTGPCSVFGGGVGATCDNANFVAAKFNELDFSSGDNGPSVSNGPCGQVQSNGLL